MSSTFRRTLLGAALLLGPVVLAATAQAAGDVTAAVLPGGTLDLLGDDEANEVQIDRDPFTGEFVVLGRNGTTVNGAEEWRSVGVRSIHAKLAAGDDVLALGGFRLPGSLFADLGDGADAFTMLRVRVRRKVGVSGGAGDDRVLIEGGCDLLAGGTVTTDDGADLVRVADSYVRGRLRIVTGAGDDRIELHRCGFTERASIGVRTEDGADAFDVLGCTLQGDVRVSTSAGTDTVRVATTRFRRTVRVGGGIDDDDIEVERCTFDAPFRIDGGEGNNRAFFLGIRINGGSTSGGGVTAGARGHSGNVWWAFVIVHVFP